MRVHLHTVSTEILQKHSRGVLEIVSLLKSQASQRASVAALLEEP